MKTIQNTFTEELIVAGFGGQGILLAGKVVAQAAIEAEMEVTYMPSYGAEVRGGTANCMVVISTEPVACPLVTTPNSLIAMNRASFQKFSSRLTRPGLLVVNSSLVDEMPAASVDLDVLAIPADLIAVELGNPKCANMVALGAYLQRRGILSPQGAGAALEAVLPERLRATMRVNAEALLRGGDFANSVR